MATNWIDGTTPVNAANLNAIESDLADLMSKSLDYSVVCVNTRQDGLSTTTGTNLTDTGIAVDVPGGAAVFLSFNVTYNNANPVRLVVKSDPDASYALYDSGTQSSGNGSACFSYWNAANRAITLYFFAQYASNNANIYACVYGFIINGVGLGY